MRFQLLLVLVCARASAQQALEFDVASLKPNLSGRPGFSIAPSPGGKLIAANISLRRLIAVAYGVTDFQIFGSIDWLDSARFDMEARAPGPAALPELRVMLRALLAERFQLKLHRESRTLRTYTLTLAKPDAPAAPGLVESGGGECSTAVAPQPLAPSGILCGTVNLGSGRIGGSRGRISQLADRLSTLLSATVVDKTGLSGYYDIAVSWTPDPDMERLMTGDRPLVNDSTAPSLFTALREQLGLRLVAGRGPVEVIVIDSVEKPSAN